MLQTPLDQEMLETLTFERSKIWANVLNQFSQLEDDKEICLSDIEDIFEGEDDKDDTDDNAADSSLEAEELDVFDDEDVLQDITNRSRVMANCTAIALQSKIKGDRSTLALDRIDDDDDVLGEQSEDVALQDLLNHTRPVLVAHERKWKEAGIDRILNTFDAQKIEEKVGGWLRRNHSVVDKPPVTNDKLKYYTPSTAKCRVRYRPQATPAEDACSDSESLHSVDTARYILSSRKRHGAAQQRFSSSCTTMTIKTFRLVQGKREALKKKYACPADSEEDELRCRRAHAQHRRYKQHQADNPLSLASASRCIQRPSYRRKILRKRRSSGLSNVSYSCSSSDDCDATYMTKGGSHCCGLSKTCGFQRRGIISNQCRSVHCDRRGRHHSCSSSSSSFLHSHSVQNTHRAKFHSYDEQIEESDPRPSKRESDCRCCNDVKLCNNIRHLADTSTEEWVVENCNSPSKWRVIPECQELSKAKVPKKSRTKNEELTRAHINQETVMIKPECKMLEKKNLTNPKSIKTRKLSSVEPCSPHDARKASKAAADLVAAKVKEPNKRKKCTKKEQVGSIEVEDNRGAAESSDDFQRQLKLAIEISKKTFEVEQKNTEKQNNTPSETSKKAALVQETKPKTKKKTKEKVTKLGKVDSPAGSSDRALKAGTKSLKLKKIMQTIDEKSVDVSEDAFFTNANSVYNSTALANDTAIKGHLLNSNNSTKIAKVVKSYKKLVKHSPAVSSTNPLGVGTSAVQSQPLPTPDDNDCTVVSSTTGDSLQRGLTEISNRHTHKGILLYTPSVRDSVPSHSFSSDGFFNITEEHLSTVIGPKPAHKFLKYYIGRRRFDSNSTIYFRPPQTAESSTDSEDDVLECVGQYGELYESLDNTERPQ